MIRKGDVGHREERCNANGVPSVLLHWTIMSTFVVDTMVLHL